MSGNDKIFQCRKCRKILFDGSCVITSRGERCFVSTESAQERSSDSQNTVWYIDKGLAPCWIQETIEKLQWTKGKLNCPKCQGRVGSFDYLRTLTLPSIHIQCCRVDFLNTLELPIIPKPKPPVCLYTASEPSYSHVLPEVSSIKPVVTETVASGYGANSNIFQEDGPIMYPKDIYHSSLDEQKLSTKSTITVGKQRAFDFNVTKKQFDNNGKNFSHEPSQNIESSNLQCKTNNCDLEEPFCDTIATVTRQTDISNIHDQTEKYRAELQMSSEDPEFQNLNMDVPDMMVGRCNQKRRCGRQGLARSHCRKGNRFDVLHVAEERRADHEIPVIQMDLPEEHVCPVCLDLFCRPMTVSPCFHVFCEPCLRNLARNKPVNTQCPMCRQIISVCNYENCLTQTLQDLYPAAYRNRIKSNRKFLDKKLSFLPGEKNPIQIQRLLHSRANNNSQVQERGIIMSNFENVSTRLKVFIQGLIGLIVLLCCVLIKFNSETLREGTAMAIPLTCLSVMLGLLLIFILFLSLWYFFAYLFMYFIPLMYQVFTVLCLALSEFIRTHILMRDMAEFSPQFNHYETKMYASNANIVIVCGVVAYALYKIYNKVIRN